MSPSTLRLPPILFTECSRKIQKNEQQRLSSKHTLLSKVKKATHCAVSSKVLESNKDDDGVVFFCL
eukprot:m.30957 g.30957  ORF g.30957 m.30957 type:complete len:66 (+) comp6868_c0_seq2:881-1078(+)